MGQHGTIRRRAPGRDRSQQRGMEPAAVLVAALQIHFSRPVEFRTLRQNRSMAGTAVEPDVHRVGFLAERIMTAMRANKAVRQNLFGAMRPPGIGSFFCKQFADRFHGRVVDDMLATVFTVENRDRHAPDALP